MKMRRLLHIGFGVLAGLLVIRAVALTVMIDERRADAIEHLSQVLNDETDSSVGDSATAGTGATALLGGDAETIAGTLNCSAMQPFDVAPPARSGFVCASQGRSTHPLTVFVYDQGMAAQASNVRIQRACEKAHSVGRTAVYVLSTEGLFVYTTSLDAVQASDVPDLFIELDSQACG